MVQNFTLNFPNISGTNCTFRMDFQEQKIVCWRTKCAMHEGKTRKEKIRAVENFTKSTAVDGRPYYSGALTA